MIYNLVQFVKIVMSSLSYTLSTVSQTTITILVITAVFAILCAILDGIGLYYFVTISFRFIDLLFAKQSRRESD